jgi:rhodanese-related sulfurtransferase
LKQLPIEIPPADVKSALDSGVPLRLIDVREPSELSTAAIEGAEPIPMRVISQHLNALEDGDALLVVFCHHGIRSLSVVEWLRRRGIENSQSMVGGIDRWSLQIDPAVPRY